MKRSLSDTGWMIEAASRIVLVGWALSVFLVAVPANAQPPQTQPRQQVFDSPAAAVDALKETLKQALQSKEQGSLQGIFGPEVADLKSGDPVQDEADLAAFSRRLHAASRLEQDGPDRVTLLVGPNAFPFPVPIVRRDGKWLFDTAAGKDEILNRRVGESELRAISVCRGYVVAQREYYLLDPANAGLPEYAQKIASSPGKRDGLYWETSPDEPPSPLGPLVARAQSEGYGRAGRDKAQTGQPRPYHGYLYRILKRQGELAPGGPMDYVINGHMVAGFALVAWPVDYGSSGIMTFLVGPGGRVYQKDLGEGTAELAAGIDAFSPDDTWEPVTE